jgi:hypothetical protein
MTTIHIPPDSPIDPYLKANRRIGTTFVLSPGPYFTRGCFDFPEHDLCMLAPGTRLLGSGPDTCIRLADATLRHGGVPTGYTEVLTGGAKVGTSPSIEVRNLRIECFAPYPTIGLHVWTAQALISGVTVQGVFGDRGAKLPNEGFGILINSAWDPLHFDGNHRVEDCVVECAGTFGENYTTAIFVGCLERGDVPLLRSVVRRCKVYASDGHAGYAFNDRTTIEDCESVGFRRAVFVDTGSVRGSEVIRMDAHRCGWALDLRGISPRRGIVLRDSTFSFRSLDGWAQAILLSDDDSGAVAEGVGVFGNTFLAPPDGRASKARLRGKKVALLAEDGNRWFGNWEAPVVQKA